MGGGTAMDEKRQRSTETSNGALSEVLVAGSATLPLLEMAIET